MAEEEKKTKSMILYGGGFRLQMYCSIYDEDGAEGDDLKNRTKVDVIT